MSGRMDRGRPAPHGRPAAVPSVTLHPRQSVGAGLDLWARAAHRLALALVRRMEMSNQAEIATSTSGDERRPRRERITLSIPQTDAATLVDLIVAAEAAGVNQLALTQTPTSSDSLTVFAAALTRTQKVRLMTSIVPT